MAFTQAMIVGASGKTAETTDANELKVYNPTGMHRASLQGDAFAWTAVSANLATTDCLILVANTSTTRLLVISYCIFQGDIVGTMTFKLGDVTGLTLAGTAIVGINLNTTSNKAAPVSAWSAETASAATDVIYTHSQSLPYAGVVGIMNRHDFGDAIIVGYNGAFGIDTILEPAAGFQATVFGYFIDA